MKEILYLGVTMVLAAASAATGKGPEALSPGSLDLPVMAPSGCPTFSWSGSSDDRNFELVVYRFDDADDERVEAVARNEIQGIAFSWTPSECFSAGHYAWVVRAGDLEWSPPRFFVVAPDPGPDELAAALAVVTRFLEQQEARVSAGSTHTDAAGSQAPRLGEARRLPPTHGVVGASTVAIRGHNQDPSGNALGVEASTDSAEGAGLLAANQAGGPDLRLDSQGGIDTEVTEAGIVRSSATPQIFDIGNPEGDLTLTIDGVAAVTTATDQDTQYSPGNQLALDGTTFDVLEGPGSGLDADTLDGMQSTAFQYTAGSGIAIDMSNTISNIGDTNAGDDLTTATVFGGEVTGTFEALDLASDLALEDGDLFDLSAVNASSTVEGLILPQSTDVSASSAEGQISWDSDNDVLYVGSGSVAVAIRPAISYSLAGGSSPVYAACPFPGVVVGGGCSATAGTAIETSCPAMTTPACDIVAPTGWLCVAVGGAPVTAYAICAE